ncbi:hypothetical protein [Fictibacillus sp. FJAT-27399]|uniref:hypothetical protein n=1 Tax=Fictibacillus sp. FJAT-27399 TaxID=1729689 RepID=UPI0012E3C713|nr:hypothetical protein [Fictibacillus sp. FJAT-27399]
MISAPGCSLLPARAPTFAGRAVSLTGVNAYFLAQAPAGSLTCHASPAGVSHLALQSTFH